MRFTRGHYGANLLTRLQIMRALLNARTRDGRDIVEREFAGRVTTSEFDDLARRLTVNRSAALDLNASPLNEAELATFVADLTRVSAFDAVLAAATRVPLRVKLGLISAAASGSIAAPGKPKPVTSVQLAGAGLEPKKATAILVATAELLEIGTLQGAPLFERELLRAVAAAQDGEFLAILTAGTPLSGASTGSLLVDLAAAYAAMPDSSSSRYFGLCSPRLLKAVATLSDADGRQLFPDVSPTAGGQVAGCQLVPCDAIPVTSAGSALVVLDASLLLMGADDPLVSLSTEASVDMQNVPTDGAANHVSLWQTNSTGILAERHFAAQLAREAAAYVVTDADYEAAP
jgi:HK97 family phage major capsid protein